MINTKEGPTPSEPNKEEGLQIAAVINLYWLQKNEKVKLCE